MGVKERRTKILLALILASDLNEQSLTSTNVNLSPVKLSEKIQKIFDFSFNQKTKGTISGLIKEGLIEKVIQSTNSPNTLPSSLSDNDFAALIKYRLTEKGFYALCLEFPFFRFIKDKWDGRWRIISYEIPESKREIRDRLRRSMQGWGLGPWHRSFWITPHPILNNLRDLVSGREEEKYIQAFEADHNFGDKKNLLEKVWAISQLDKKYRELFRFWHEVLSKEGDKIEKLKKIITNYISLLRNDPGLPQELLGKNWIGFEGFNIYKEIKNILLA
ncbi:MAG: PaaX family transcriptional regulator C-terminal domain-containing protein [Microgenomates group bacterium]|nr:PaaX family transcriptional regulator C-terminal domain-containing protein [Microgenomates group bacterium]